jgi:type IV secretory pathway ATPase VirB11/archaellum biosynthesis ATPase
LVENPEVDSVVLAGLFEREYQEASLSALKELAEVVGDSKTLFRRFKWGGCTRCRKEWEQRVEHSVKELPRDPVKALGEITDFIRELERPSRAKLCTECRRKFREVLMKFASPIKNIRLVKEASSEKKYADILKPSVKPCFQGSKLVIDPPKNAELVEAYEFGDGDVRIYFLPDKLEHLYLLIPSEHRLTHEQVSLLSRAKQALLGGGYKLDFSRGGGHLKSLGRHILVDLALKGGTELQEAEIDTLVKHLVRFTAGTGLLEILLGDPKVQDIYLDAPLGETPLHIYHQDFEECRTNIYMAPGEAEALASRFRAISERSFSEASPILDLDLGGVRVAAIGPPLSPKGIAFALRRHKPTPWTLPQFVQAKFITSYAAGLLSLLVDSQASILVTGSRGAGKSSLLGALMLELLPKYRIITIEDVPELPLWEMRSLGFKIQSLQVQSATSNSQLELRAEDALRAALRFGESVLVIGEVRGSEAKTLYEAMRVGAAGNSVMGTIHGASTRDVFERVVHDLGISPSSFTATDAIVVAVPIRFKGGLARQRRVVEIAEVDKNHEGKFNPLMRYEVQKDLIEPTELLTSSTPRIIRHIAMKWGTSPGEVMKNLDLRTKIQERLVGTARKFNRPELLEAKFTVRSNLTFHRLLEAGLRKRRAGYSEIFIEWCKWLDEELAGGSRC